MPGAGDCFLIETDRYEDGSIRSHLHVVILDCEEFTGTTIIVVIETWSKKKDGTTILRPGAHEFIKQDSYVNYRRAKTTSNTDIQRLIDAGKAKALSPITEDVLTRIQQGIASSSFTPKYVVDVYQHMKSKAIKR